MKISVAVVETTVLGVKGFHARCLHCKWTGRGRSREAAALRDAKAHGAEHAKPKSAVTRVNQQLKKLGREERLVRGRGYYYLTGGEAHTFHTSSIYACWIEPKDFAFAASEVNDIFRREKIDARIEIPQADIDLDVQNRAIIQKQIAADKAARKAK